MRCFPTAVMVLSIGTAVVAAESPEHPLHAWTTELQDDNLEPWQRAMVHGRQANEALRRCHKYVNGWLAHADPQSGLIPKNLGKNNFF